MSEIEREAVIRSTPYGKTRMMEHPFVVSYTQTVVLAQGEDVAVIPSTVTLLTCDRCGATVLAKQEWDVRDPAQVHTEWHARYR